MEKDNYKITKTDGELVSLVSRLQSGNNFANFCNIVISRAVKCWQSGLENYPFGEKRYSDQQSKREVLEILGMKPSSGSFNRDYELYVKESLCLYHKIYERKQKLKKINRINEK